MKKTLITAAVTFALAAPFSVNAAPDDQFLGNDASITGTGAYSTGALSPAVNAPVTSYTPTLVNSQGVQLTNGFNDVNSDNVVSISEDGIVAFAQDLDQAALSSDLEQIVAGNLVVDNSARSLGALSPAANTPVVYTTTRANTMSLGSFNNYGGIATTGQNIGHSTAVQQAVSVQSNGGV